MPFEGLYSSNHADVADSYYPQIVAFAKANGGKEAAALNCTAAGGVGGVPGAVHFAVQIAPGGLSNYRNSLGIHTNAAFAALNFVSAFQFSQDAGFLNDVSYPLLRAVAAWWRCFMTKTPSPGALDGYVYNDYECTREGCGGTPGHKMDTNPAIVVAFANRILRHLVDVADRGLVSPPPPAAELAGWKELLGHLPPIPQGVAEGRPVLLPQQAPIYTFPQEAHDNPLEFYGIFPGEQIGLSSPAALLEAARNTVLMAEVVDPLQENGFQEIFPSFVRAAINASFVVAQLEAVLAKAMPPNGYVAQGGGGIETAGATVAVNDMLLHSWEGFVRLFPVWPRGSDAAFTTLRAVGAFLVSASIKAGAVSDVTVVSEAGEDFVVLGPWGGKGVAVVFKGTGAAVPTTAATVRGVAGLCRFGTVAGATYILSSSERQP